MSQNIKKVTITSDSLPSLSSKNSFYGYKLRYRIVSEDRNRTSTWSPMYKISANDIVKVAGTTSNVSKTVIGSPRTSTKVSLAWTPPDLLKYYTFDIFIKTNLDSDYVLYGSTTNTSFDLLFPATTVNGSINSIDYWVQVSTSDKKTNKNLMLFKSDSSFSLA